MTQSEKILEYMNSPWKEKNDAWRTKKPKISC